MGSLPACLAALVDYYSNKLTEPGHLFAVAVAVAVADKLLLSTPYTQKPPRWYTSSSAASASVALQRQLSILFCPDLQLKLLEIPCMSVRVYLWRCRKVKRL